VTDEVLEQQRAYIMRSVEDRGVRLVRMWFTDILGNLKSFAISPAELDNALIDGMTFDGSSIDGFSRIQEADVLAVPDANTFVVLPWGDPKNPEARIFCDINHLDGTPFDGDSRQVLKRHMRAAHAEGFTFYVAPYI
jgi:glutamine synthetase